MMADKGEEEEEVVAEGYNKVAGRQDSTPVGIQLGMVVVGKLVVAEVVVEVVGAVEVYSIRSVDMDQDMAWPAE